MLRINTFRKSPLFLRTKPMPPPHVLRNIPYAIIQSAKSFSFSKNKE